MKTKIYDKEITKKIEWNTKYNNNFISFFNLGCYSMKTEQKRKEKNLIKIQEEIYEQ